MGEKESAIHIDLSDTNGNDFKYISIEVGGFIFTPNIYVDGLSYTPVDKVTNFTEEFSYTIIDDNGNETSTANLTINIDGNDIITYDSTALMIDGSLGIDTLLVSNDDDLNFNTISNLKNMEIIDLASDNHTITNLDVADILNMTDADNTLTIYGDAGDSVSKPAGTSETWTKTDSSVDDGNGHTVDVYNVSDGSNTVTVNIEQEIIVS